MLSPAGLPGKALCSHWCMKAEIVSKYAYVTFLKAGTYGVIHHDNAEALGAKSVDLQYPNNEQFQLGSILDYYSTCTDHLRFIVGPCFDVVVVV